MKFKIFSFAVLSVLIFGCSTLSSNPAIKEIQISAGNVTLFVRIAGDPSSGNVLIGINGGPGQSSAYMRSLDRLAGAEFAVVTFDQRGTGRSTAPSDGYGLTEYAADLEAVRQAVGAGKVHIFGHSWGGIIAVRYAADYPRNVRSIILMATGPPARKATLAGQAMLNERIKILHEQGIIVRPQPRNEKDVIKAILPAYFSDPEFQVPAELKNTEFNAATYQKTLAELGDWDFSADLGRITHPVLFLWGEDDPFGLPMAEATKNALSNADMEFALLKACGHYWHECTDTFFARVRAFLHLSPGSARKR